MKVKEVFKECQNRLRNCSIETYRSDCLFLISHLLGIPPSLLALKEEEEFFHLPELEKLIEKRCKERIPVQHLLGEWDCLGRTFKVFPRVLAPRGATEILIETTIGLIEEKFDHKKEIKGLEIGTGTGCISINLLLEFPELQMVGVEIDPTAVENTIENAKSYGVLDRFKVIKGDIFTLCGEFKNSNQRFDFIVSNPPYIAEEDREKLPPEVLYENPVALFGGKFGTKFHEFYAIHCKELLNPNGFMVLEFEPFQKEHLQKFFQSHGWKVEFVKDFAGKERVLVAYPI
jgi:release factor glutamine methyltransferase